MPFDPRPAKWEVWARVGECALWKAAVLSLGYEPDLFALHPGADRDLVVPAVALPFTPGVAAMQMELSLAESIYERLKVFSSNLKTGFAAHSPINFERAAQTMINLAEVWSWAESMWDDLPIGYRAARPKPRLALLAAPMPGVPVALPHTTKALEAIFAIVRKHWEKFDGTNEPSQTTIALEIGEVMNWKPEASGKPARAAQAIAGLFRPDHLAEADRRTALGKKRK